MKTFIDNYEPIEVKLVSFDGAEHQLTSKFMSSSDIKEIEQLAKNNDVLGTDLIYYQLKKIFGNTEKFYSQFSFDILKSVVQHVTDQQREGLKKKNG